MRWANGSRGYQLSDQGCFKIRTRAEVIALAAAPIGPRCPCCGTATAWGPASPWGDDPTPDTCVACDNANVRASEIA